jgi:hypothetical protein
MRRVGGLLAVVMVAGATLFGAAGAGAAEPPRYVGDMTFPKITGPEGPEAFSWQIWLEEGQELRQVDGQRAVVLFENGLLAFSIAAEEAHDAEGTGVPTTLTVTQPNIITLTVLHREGNPEAGDAPFRYPIVAGRGWSGGFQTHIGGGITEQPAEPAEPANAQRVRVIRALGEDKLYYRPHFFLLSGDGSFGLNKVQWKSWGGATARATARGFVNDCIPYCAAGHIDRPPARLTLSKIVDCNGTPIYARLEYALSGPLPKGFPRKASYSMRPLGEDGKPEC